LVGYAAGEGRGAAKAHRVSLLKRSAWGKKTTFNTNENLKVFANLPHDQQFGLSPM
jgi:hypothetical protein